MSVGTVISKRADFVLYVMHTEFRLDALLAASDSIIGLCTVVVVAAAADSISILLLAVEVGTSFDGRSILGSSLLLWAFVGGM